MINDVEQEENVLIEHEEPIAEPAPTPTGEEEQAEPKRRGKKASALQKIKDKAKEGDDAPSSSLRFRDIVGGDYLWMLVRNQIWLIILIVVITTAYIAIRYQCQQDVIDISQLEKQLVESKFKAMSSSSNLTRLCRKSNVLQVLKEAGDTTLHISPTPPYIIEIPDE